MPAPTASLILSGQSENNIGAPTVLGSVTPKPNSLLVFLGLIMGDGFGPTWVTTDVEILGGGVTWKYHSFVNKGTWSVSPGIMTAQMGATPGTFNVSIDCINQIGWMGFSIYEVIGYDVNLPSGGSVAIDAGGLETFNLALPNAPRTDDLVLAIAGADAAAFGSPGNTGVTWGAGMTRDFDVAASGSTLSYGSFSSARRIGSTSTTVPISDINNEGTGGIYTSAGAAIVIRKAPNIVAADDFTRANGGFGSNWSTATFFAANNPIIASNVATTSAGPQDAISLCTGFGALPADQFCEVSATLGNGACAVGVLVRGKVATASGYEGSWTDASGGTYQIYSYSTLTVLGTVTGVGITGTRKLRLEAVGSTITLYVDGIRQISLTNTDTSGSGNDTYPALWVATTSGTVVTADNFVAGDWSNVPSYPQVMRYAEVSDWYSTSDNGTKTIPNVAWNAGDTIVVVGGIANVEWNSVVLNTPTNANLTFQLVTSVNTPGSPEAAVYYWIAQAKSAQTGQTISIPQSNSPATQHATGAGVIVLRGAGGVGNATANLNETAISRTVRDKSTVLYGLIDWNAVNPPGKTPLTGSGTAVERRDAGDGTSYAQWFADWSNVSSGIFNFGPNNYTSLKVAQAIVEARAVGTIIATDDFNRVNAALGSNWTAANFTISGNDVSSSAGGSQAVWTGNSFGNDQWAEVDVTLGTDDSGVILRRVDSNNFYFGFWTTASSGSYQIWKFVGGSPSQIASAAAGATSGTKRLRMEVVGSTLTLYADGVEVVTTTDTAHSSGSTGIWAGDTTAIFDNFSAGDLIVSTSPATINPPGSNSATVSGTAQLTVATTQITDYLVQYRTTSGPGAWQTFTDAVSATTGASVTGLSPGVSYDFRVSAINAFGRGLWSNIATVVAGSGGVVIKLKLGDTQVSAIKLGDTAVNKAYLGDTLVVG
jgi:hypothetical protein